MMNEEEMERSEQEAQTNAFYGGPAEDDATLEYQDHEKEVLEDTADKACDLLDDLVTCYKIHDKKGVDKDADALDNDVGADLDDYPNLRFSDTLNDEVSDLLDPDNKHHKAILKHFDKLTTEYVKSCDADILLHYDY